MSNATIAERKPGKLTLQSVYGEMLRLRERVEDLEDLRELNAAIARNRNWLGDGRCHGTLQIQTSRRLYRRDYHFPREPLQFRAAPHRTRRA